MRVFVYDDACVPCTRAARFLTGRCTGPDPLRVLPYSRVAWQLDPASRERFRHEALFVQGPAPTAEQEREARTGPERILLPEGLGLPGREFWGHRAIGQAQLASSHRIDRFGGRVILSPLMQPLARRVYGWVSRHRWVIGTVLR